MRYPSKKKLKEMEEKLKNVKGTRPLPKNAGPIARFKFELCKLIVIYLHDNRMTQAEFAEKYNIDPARLSEIVHYRFDKFSIEKLFSYVQEIYPDVEPTLKTQAS